MKNRKQEKQRRKQLARQAFKRNGQRQAIAIALDNCEWLRDNNQLLFYREQVESLRNLRKGNSGPGYVLFRYRRINRNQPAKKYYLKETSDTGAVIWLTGTHTRARTFKTRSAAQAFKDQHKLDGWAIE